MILRGKSRHRTLVEAEERKILNQRKATGQVTNPMWTGIFETVKAGKKEKSVFSATLAKFRGVAWSRAQSINTMRKKMSPGTQKRMPEKMKGALLKSFAKSNGKSPQQTKPGEILQWKEKRESEKER